MPVRKIVYLLFIFVTLSACTLGSPELTETVPPEPAPTIPPSDTPLPPTATFTPSQTPQDTHTPTPTLPVEIGSLQLAAVLEPVLFGGVIDFRLLPDGRLMLTTSRGYAIFDGDDIFLQIAGHSQQLVGVDDQERMWFFIDGDGSRIFLWDGGLDFVLVDRGWETVEDIGRLIGQGVVTDGEGNVWLYTDRDVRKFDGEAWTIYGWGELGMPIPPYDEIIRNLSLHYLKGNNQIWVASCFWGGPGPLGGGGVRWYENGIWKGGGTSVREGCALSVTEDDFGRVWMGVDDVLRIYDPQTAQWLWLPFPEPTESQQFRFAGDIVVSPSGEPWASFLLCGGASCQDFSRFRIQGDAWVQIGNPYFSTQSLLFDQGGSPWIFGEGVTRVEDDQSVLVSDLIVEAVTEDGEGQIWMIGHPIGGEMAMWVMGRE